MGSSIRENDGILSEATRRIHDFNKAFGHPSYDGDLPVKLDDNRKMARASWMREEIQEFLDARTIAEEVDALVDCLYFVIGTAVEMNVDLSEPFEMVHNANMQKLFPDGKPHYNQDNKVINPEGGVAPDEKIRD